MTGGSSGDHQGPHRTARGRRPSAGTAGQWDSTALARSMVRRGLGMVRVQHPLRIADKWTDRHTGTLSLSGRDPVDAG